MGAWGHGNFENDDAIDFLADVADQGEEFVANFLSEIGDSGYIEAPEGCSLIVAGELMAAARGMAPVDAPDTFQDAVEKISPAFANANADRVRRLIGAVRDEDRSELRELWQETGDGSEWETAVGDLTERLRDT